MQKLFQTLPSCTMQHSCEFESAEVGGKMLKLLYTGSHRKRVLEIIRPLGMLGKECQRLHDHTTLGHGGKRVPNIVR